MIFSRQGGADGFYPFASVTLDHNGNLYAMAPNGGDPSCPAYFDVGGCGVIYKISR